MHFNDKHTKYFTNGSIHVVWQLILCTKQNSQSDTILYVVVTILTNVQTFYMEEKWLYCLSFSEIIKKV